jgi:flagellar motility protein MotE (MotC chaperone)
VGLVPGEEMKMIIEMKEDIAGIKSLLTTMVRTNEVALKALDSSSSAHHRLDKVEKEIDDLEKKMVDLEKKVDAKIEKLKEDQNWIPKLITSCVITSVVAGFIGFAVSNMF